MFIMKGCFAVNYTVSHVSEEDIAGDYTFLHNDTVFFLFLIGICLHIQESY